MYFANVGYFDRIEESLAELKATTLKILSTASFHRYSEKDILNQIDFVMMDSTSHNLEVIESVYKKSIPGTLLSNIH